MVTFNMFGDPVEYRRKWHPAKPEDYDKYWRLEDHYNYTEFYEIHPLNDDSVIVKYFEGDRQVGERVTFKTDLKMLEMAISDHHYYREIGEKY